MPLDITVDDRIKIETNEAFSRTDKLHVLLDYAIHDFERVLTRPKHRIDFGCWYDAGEDGECNVCLAGAVMATRLQAVVGADPDHLGVETARRLHAIDQLRMGRITAALEELHAQPMTPTWKQRRLNTRWSAKLAYMRENPDLTGYEAHAFLRTMRRLKAELQALDM